uniref:Uncharacterized protein n=1 Tax=Arundo donax TaxID=35708 RepID=A0A0A9DNK6_ARUDO
MGGEVGTSTTRRTRTRAAAREAQKAMWIMVREMGKGQPYILGSRMYLLYTITEKLRLIQMPTYAYDSITDLSTDGGAAGAGEGVDDDTSMAALPSPAAVSSPAPIRTRGLD